MQDHEQQAWRTLLHKRRADLLHTLSSRLHDTEPGTRALNVRLEPGDDAGAAAALADRGLSWLRHEQEELAAIDAALLRLQDNSFGLCQACGQPIGNARLQAQPSAALCLSCQEDLESQRHQHGHRA